MEQVLIWIWPDKRAENLSIWGIAGQKPSQRAVCVYLSLRFSSENGKSPRSLSLSPSFTADVYVLACFRINKIHFSAYF